MTINAISKSAIIQPGADGGLYSFQPAGGNVAALTASAVGTSAVRLSWQEDIADETAFRVYRGTTTATLAIIGTTAANGRSFFDSGLSAGTSKVYKVTAWNGSQEYGAAYVEGTPEDSYVSTVTVTTQAELNDALSAATSGTVIGVVYNATPYTISAAQLQSRSFTPGGLVITQSGGTMPVFSQILLNKPNTVTLHSLEVYNTGLTKASGLISIYKGSSSITVDSCVVHGAYRDPNGDWSAANPVNPIGINRANQTASETQNVTIVNNTIYDVYEGIVFGCAGTETIVGNTIYNHYEDAIKITGYGQTSTVVNWNTLYNAYALGTDVNNPHSDSIQLVPGTTAADWGGVEVIGNVMFAGNTRGGNQGILMNGVSLGYFFTATVKGNLCCGSVNVLAIESARDCTLIGNTVVPFDIDQPLKAIIFCGSDEDGGGNVIKNCVAYSIPNYGATITNCHQYTPSQTTGALSALFDGTAFNNSDLDTPAHVKAAYSMKVAGALDTTTNIGAVGSGYVDFDLRTINGAME